MGMDTTAIRKAAQAKNTRVAYKKGWRRFATYCEERKIVPLEASVEDVARFFMVLSDGSRSCHGSGLSLGTLRIFRSALNRRYAEAGLASPAASMAVAETLRGLARIQGYMPRRVKALREHELLRMIELCPTTRFGCRDAAMLSLGFAAALRRSELCGLRVEDIAYPGPDRMVVRIRKSKTDQPGRGQSVAVPDGKAVKPVSRLRFWLRAVGIRQGYLFQTLRRGGVPSGRALSHSEVPRLIKKYVGKIGLDPGDYSGHSLRAGFVTSAAAHRARIDKIMEVTRHRNPATVLTYMRDTEAFDDHAGEGFL